MYDDYDYENGVANTQWLINKKEAIDAAPVRGEDGWSPELEAERQAIYEQLG